MSEDSLPSFRLYADPVGEGRVRRSDATRAACGRARGWVSDAILYTSGRSKGVMCPWCIADGTAVRKWGGTFNEVADPLPADRLEEVCERTPGIGNDDEYVEEFLSGLGGGQVADHFRCLHLRYRHGRVGQRLSLG